jgi:hypothetical protein
VSIEVLEPISKDTKGRLHTDLYPEILASQVLGVRLGRGVPRMRRGF